MTLSRPAALFCLSATQAALFAGLAWLAVAGRLNVEALAAGVALASAALTVLLLRLYRQQAAARRASAVKSAFLAQMNHELRTPLSGVIANLELLRASELTRDQRDLVDGCMNAGKGLLGVIGNSLDLSRIEAGKLTLAPAEFDLREMLDSVASIYRSAALNKQTELSTAVRGTAPRRIVADEMRLRQVLCNLLGNAVKFTEAGRICLAVRAERIDAGSARLHFTVEDTGIGFPAEAAATLFEPFRQADSTVVRDFGGSGLGLAITQRLVALHGGEITCTAEPGAGASFKVSLTVPASAWDTEERAAAAPPAPPSDRAAPLHRFAPGAAPSLLVVEDQPMNRNILARQLRRLGIDCDMAADGLEALTLLDHRHYDVIITDCAMPGMDGLELIRRIRTEEEIARRPRARIVVLTANAIKGLAEDCREAGADAFLAKPLKLTALSAFLTQERPEEPAAAPHHKDAAAAPIDRGVLAELIGRDDAPSIDRLARDFFECWQESLADIVRRYAEADAEGLAEAAHAAKGTARYGAAHRLAAGCARLEALAHDGRRADCAAALEDLQTETYRLQTYLTDTGVIGYENRRSA
ncbi:ATP-binding protein [Pelagibius marinus]|uniref:ATP-binding protein n=1 Tax=Pelagibius marinus TaxID=2762760 RepID=UPI0018733AA4|nr:ATP-binding protein [Pelagibius marinus]